MAQKYVEIEKEVVKRYNVELCDGSLCSDGDWSRMHAHVKKRRICKFKFKNSIQTLFDLMHEIGHLETTKSGMRRCEEEFLATRWAIIVLQDEYELDIPQSIIEDYQRYVYMERDRGVRRGGKNYPSKKDLSLYEVWNGKYVAHW